MAHETSSELYARAISLMPGGVSSPVRAVKPFPLYISRGQGGLIFDEEGDRYVDTVLGFGPLILGHAHPSVVKALQEQAADGTLYGAPHRKEVELAEMVNSHFPSMEMMRFVSSGTEATMHALRLARGCTGRDTIVKMDGGFHGAHDSVLVRSGSGALEHGVPDSLGVPGEVAGNTLVTDYNDPVELSEMLDVHRDQVAAVILEPMLGNVGPVSPNPGYLKEVRRITEEHGVLLIFDEVITGLRLSLGGAQRAYGVRPDITVLGKVLGGGLPMGAFGASREIMSNISPVGKVYQAGTYGGNPMSLTAGIETIRELDRIGLDGLNAEGERLRSDLARSVRKTGNKVTVRGEASMFQVFFGDGPLQNSRQIMTCDRERYMSYYRSMLRLGIYLPPSQFETCFLCAAHEREDLRAISDSFAQSMEVLE